jgi:Zn-dependent peptidase ImmA (M78 family)
LESASAIEAVAAKLLRSADAYGRIPTPVDEIIEVAKLTMADDYVLNESMISRAPAWMREKLRSVQHKTLGLVDRRERVVHIDPGIEHEGKRRFVTFHEVIHDATPHQKDLLYADDNDSLSPATRRLFEREANYGAAELLFQREFFAREVRELEVSTGTVWHLSDRYGASFHATLRRYAEMHPQTVAAIVLDRRPLGGSPTRWKRDEYMVTPAWVERFGAPVWPNVMSELEYPFLSAVQFDGLNEAPLSGGSGERPIVRVDTCTNTYKKFVLLWMPKKTKIRRPVRVRAA